MELIISLEDVQEESADAVISYKQDMEAKERQYHMNEMNSQWYSLPDEVLQQCIAFMGEGHYALVAAVSKKVYNAHEQEFDSEERSYPI